MDNEVFDLAQKNMSYIKNLAYQVRALQELLPPDQLKKYNDILNSQQLKDDLNPVIDAFYAEHDD